MTTSKIYKLVNDVDDKVYIGSTTSPLSKRKAEHKCNAKRYPNRTVYKHLNTVGWSNVHIILLERVECLCKVDLHMHERRWIDLLKPELNKAIPCRTRKEHYRDNKAKIQAYKKQYSQKNREQIRVKNNQYNRTRLTQKVNCECGTVTSLHHFKRHQRSRKHVRLLEQITQ